MSGSFRPGHTGASPADSRPPPEGDHGWLLPLLEGRARVAELGCGGGGRAARVLSALPELASYEGFEPSRRLLERPLEAGPVRLRLHDPALALPLPDASQDAVLTLDLCEFLRMDQLYMVAAEARRVLRPGGIWVLRSLAPQEGIGARARAWLLAKRTGCRALELTHYISPEDWRERENRREERGGLIRQVLLLERL